ncbi:MAG TPA: hypothetical protein VFY43_00795 [Candidatus Limnocylindria bacterium]|nr:hypothetical protein [Candidatus Limnocylindria bacterium]
MLRRVGPPVAAVALVVIACARPEPSITMNDAGCSGSVSDLMTGQEFIAFHNDTDDLVGFAVMWLNGSFAAYADEVAAIRADVAASPASLGTPSADVSLPSSGISYGNDALLEPGKDAEVPFEFREDMTFAVVCTRYGPLRATVRDIGVIGPLQAED